MSKVPPLELRVGVDVGCHSHNVAIGLSAGEILDEFDVSHTPEGFHVFFSRIEKQQRKYKCPVAVAMEGFNGYARPLDTLVRGRDYRLFNVNNMKLARFKEIFPGAAKTDRIDARKCLELFQLRDLLPLAKDALQEVASTPAENEVLKRLTRRRRRLVNEKARVLNNIQGDLQAVGQRGQARLSDISRGNWDQAWGRRMIKPIVTLTLFSVLLGCAQDVL